MTDDWKGEHLIRLAPLAATVATAAIDQIDAPPLHSAEKAAAVRNAALSGMSRPEAAELLGLSYNTVVWICERDGIRFPDARQSRRREGGV